MLVLTRKQKESIKIGDSIVVTILRVQGQSVRVGIEAPREVRVVRGELAASKPQDNAETEAEPQVIEFRFTPEQPSSDSSPPRTRGPLASLMATLHTSGAVAHALGQLPALQRSASGEQGRYAVLFPLLPAATEGGSSAGCAEP